MPEYDITSLLAVEILRITSLSLAFVLDQLSGHNEVFVGFQYAWIQLGHLYNLYNLYIGVFLGKVESIVILVRLLFSPILSSLVQPLTGFKLG